MMKTYLFGVVMLLVAGLSGCGAPVSNQPTGTGTPSGPAAGLGTVVAVGVKEWSIDLAPKAVPAGAVTLRVRNDGKEPHGIYIDGPSIDRKAPRLEPGGTADITLSVPTGEFHITDFVKDNEFAHNMKATLQAR